MLHQLNKIQRLWLEELCKKEYGALLAIARNRSSSRFMAEEALQKTLLMACEKIDELMASPRPGGWLTNTLINTIGTLMRTQKRADNIFISEMGLDENRIAVWTDDIHTLDDIGVRALGERDYYIMKYVLLKEISADEAAAELGISVAACRKRIERNKKKLRKILEKI